MPIQFKPSALTTIITTVAFSLFCLVAFTQPGGIWVGFLFLFIPGLSIAIYISSYRKFIVTLDNLQVVNWFGTVRSEIQFKDITNMFVRKGFKQVGVALKMDVDVIILVLDLKDKPAEHINLSDIFEYEELVSLVRSRWENANKLI